MLLAALLLALAGPHQGEGGCKRCQYRGMVPCTAHTEELRELEGHVQFCSLIARCERCGGTLLEDCPRCDGGPDQAVAAERRAAIEAWLAETRLEKLMGRPLPRLETVSFQLVIDAPTLPEGRKKVDPHLLAHRVADDVEHVAAKVNEHYGFAPSDYQSKMRMWLWNNVDEHAKAMAQFFETGSTGDFKMLGVNPTFSVWTEPNLFDTVPTVRTLFAHNAGHMLLSNAISPRWVGDVGGGWLDAGAGHWYEYERFARTSNYCIEEATVSENYENGLWRAAIRKRLAMEEERLLPSVFDKNTGAMRQSEQALCWSFYDWLVHEHQAALRPILADLKAREKPPRELLAEHLGMGLLEAEAAWREWVAAVYPTRGDEPKTPEDR